MSDVPLYDLLEASSFPAPMEEYLRDRNRPEGYVEARRKAALRDALTKFRSGESHPLTFLMATLDSTLPAARHGLHHLRSLAQDQNSFDHYFHKLKKETPEKFQPARKAHINMLAMEMISYGAASFQIDDSKKLWADKLLAALDDPVTKAIDVVEEITDFFVPKSQFERRGIKQDISNCRDNEKADILDHPNDPHIEQDLLKVMGGYRNLSWADSSTRDQYQTQKSVELRRATEIVDILEKWKEGRHPLLVISDILATVVPNLEHRYRRMIEESQSAIEEEKKARREHAGHGPQSSNEYSLVSTLLEQEKLRRYARAIMRQMHETVVSYRGPESNPDFAAAIDGYIDHLVNTPQSSFKILNSIAQAMFTENSKALVDIRSDLSAVEEKEEAVRKANAPMGTLKTQTEDEIKQPLAAVFESRARPEPLPDILTREIHIEPAGAGMIKPFPPGEYDERWEEEMYGTVTARITTYAVTLIPVSPDKADALAKRVRQVMAEVAATDPAYDIPYDRMAKPYARPHPQSEYSQAVRIVDGTVKVYSHLDLDDVWNLYYLLEDSIEPSAQIAAAMNGARYAEARGVLLGIADEEPNYYAERGTRYTNHHFRPEERLGSLEYHRPEIMSVA